VYIPPYFKNEDIGEIENFVNENSFGILLSADGDEVKNSHLPFIVKFEDEKIKVYGHMAKENDHWRSAKNRKVSILFQGPHHYISARWYTVEKSVPTWDYAIVKMTGIFKISNRKDTLRLLKELAEKYDTEWSKKKMEEETYYHKMINEIVAFSVEVDRLEAKWKMSQNWPKKDRNSVVENLEKIGTEQSIKVAEIIKKH
jgi:transcriptional regulator